MSALRLLRDAAKDRCGVNNGGADRATDASGVTLTPDVLYAVRPLRLRADCGPMQCSKGPYSITSSARCWRNQGTSSSSAFAVLRLITSSNLTGAWTGSSLG